LWGSLSLVRGARSIIVHQLRAVSSLPPAPPPSRLRPPASLARTQRPPPSVQRAVAHGRQHESPTMQARDGRSRTQCGLSSTRRGRWTRGAGPSRPCSPRVRASLRPAPPCPCRSPQLPLPQHPVLQAHRCAAAAPGPLRDESGSGSGSCAPWSRAGRGAPADPYPGASQTRSRRAASEPPRARPPGVLCIGPGTRSWSQRPPPDGWTRAPRGPARAPCRLPRPAARPGSRADRRRLHPHRLSQPAPHLAQQHLAHLAVWEGGYGGGKGVRRG
jgi:hypothetical protein